MRFSVMSVPVFAAILLLAPLPAIAIAPVITSGTGTITQDATGTYILDCPNGCTFDFGTSLIAVSTTGTTTITLDATGIVSINCPSGCSSGTLATVGGTLTTTSIGQLDTTATIGGSTNATIGGATLVSGNLTGTITGTPVSFDTILADGGRLTINGNGSLSLSSNTIITTPVTLDSTFNVPPADFTSLLNNQGWVTNAQADSVGALIRSGINVVLFGSHHRILRDNGLTESGTGFWATGDYARHNGNDTKAEIGEIGFYKDVSNESRLGIGAGSNQATQALPYGGSGKQDSRYLVLEGDYYVPDTRLTGSATVFLGSSSSTITRGYLVGTTPNLSTGEPGGSSWALRLRGDWMEIASFANFDVSTYAAYTRAVSRLEAYTETGGALPVSYSAQQQTSDEVRLGTTFKSKLEGQTILRFPLELVHRKNSGSALSGVAAAIPFAFDASQSTQSWGRVGIEADRHLAPLTLLNAALIAAGNGGDSSWLASISLRHTF